MSRQPTHIHWGIIFTGLCLMVFFWVLDAFIDGVIFAEGGFFPQLLNPVGQELVYRIEALLFFCLFAGYAWRQTEVQRRLKVSLEESVSNLKTERARAEAILAAMGDAVTVQDRDLKILYQNQAHKIMLGDHLGEFCYAAYHRLDEVCPECNLVKTLADGLVHSSETCMETDQGTRYREICSSPLRDASGAIIAGIESVRDMTDRKLTDIHLRKLLAAVETSMDGIAILTGAGEYLYLNEAHAAIYGYQSPGELIGRNWHVLYDDQERQRLEPLIQAGFETERGWRGEATGLKKDRSSFPQEISLSALDDDGMICVVRDISDRKRSEQAISSLNGDLEQHAFDLQASNRELTAFSYSLSHDLRSPLTRISLAAQTMVEMYGESFDETGDTLLHAINTGCADMEKFIEGMLVLFRVTQEEIHCRDVDLSSLTEEIMAEFRIMQPERRVELAITPGLVACCDPQLIRILLENLLGNAWKYTSKVEQARFEFGRNQVNGVATFFIRDNGAGFDMAEAERLFKPFQRLHCSSDFPGTGIGLATVLRAVKRHGGKAWGEGVPDRGATFYFTLGRSEPSPPNPEP